MKHFTSPAKLFLSLYGGLSGLFMFFYGTAWIIRGYLTFESRYLPRFLGMLMVAAGVGFFTKNVTKVLAPADSSDILLAPSVDYPHAIDRYRMQPNTECRFPATPPSTRKSVDDEHSAL